MPAAERPRVAGDSVRLAGLDSGDTVRVVWRPGDAGPPTEFGSYEVP
ncbi:hypothetical protein [Halorientalis marina]|nr:hypothetical protein [Halorientalis marina]